MYNVLNIFKKLEPTQEQQVKAEAQSIYESVEAKGSILEGVKGVEEKLNEKYLGFKKVAAAAKAGGAENPEAVAASIGRKKYGKKAFQKAAASGTKMREEDIAEGEREDQPTIPGTDKKAKSRYNPTNKPAPVKKLDKPTDKFDKIKNEEQDVAEVAPPGKKAEKMVKSIKAGYANDGKLTDKEKGIAYATAWKAHKAGKVEEDTETVDDFIARGGKVTVGKTHRPRKSERDGFSSNHLGKFGAMGNSKGKMTGRGAKVMSKDGGKPVVRAESRQIAEGINFAEMMRETDTGIAEMLSEIQADIDSFKKTGHCSDKLEAFLKIHNHGKRLMGEAVPKGDSFAPQDAMALAKPKAPFVPSRTQGKPSMLDRAKDAVGSVASGINKVIGHGSDEELLADLRNKSTFEDVELNELARLAGLTMESKKSDKADKDYDGDGEIESSKDEVIGSRRKAAGLDEAKPDFLDVDKDGNKKEPMKKALKDKDQVDESCMSCDAEGMEQQQGRINVSTNASTDGNKNVTITADGDAADQLMSMLKMAGLGNSEAHARLATSEPEAIEVEMDEAEEQYANTPEECYQGQDVINHQGADMNREKKQFAGMPKAGDNPMATPSMQALESMDPMDDMGRRLMREYQSLKLRK
jgi:hypothetical protein